MILTRDPIPSDFGSNREKGQVVKQESVPCLPFDDQILITCHLINLIKLPFSMDGIVLIHDRDSQDLKLICHNNGFYIFHS